VVVQVLLLIQFLDMVKVVVEELVEELEALRL
jgi:hypothetical protein